MQLSIVILNYNVRYFLELCLQSVQKAIEGLNAEIIVIDNNSPDDSCAMVKQQFPKVILIENKENVGFSKANNQAVEVAKGEYVCILNPDTVVTENTFINCLKKAESLQNLGLLGIHLIDGKGRFLSESKRNLPTPKVSLFKILGQQFSKIAPYYVDSVLPEGEGNISILVGAFMFCKKTVYQQVSGFDEDYFMYGEDIDLSYKILKAGYKNYYFGSEKIIHFKGESTLKDSTYRKRFYGAMKLFYKKHFNASFFINTIIYTGIKLASLLQIASKSANPVQFSVNYLVSDNNFILHALQKKLTQRTEIISAENLPRIAKSDQSVCCFLDLNCMSFSKAIEIISTYKKSNIYFRFIPIKNSYALGSDTSTGRGVALNF